MLPSAAAFAAKTSSSGAAVAASPEEERSAIFSSSPPPPLRLRCRSRCFAAEAESLGEMERMLLGEPHSEPPSS